MEKGLRKRLEEAAREAGGCSTCIVHKIGCEGRCSTYFVAHKGAEFGCKEAIVLAKEWLLQHLPTPDWYSSTEEFVADFETDMNKLID